MVGVNLDANPIDGLNCKLENELNWRSFYDGTNLAIHDGFGVLGIPTVIIIDHKGKIRWIGHRFNDDLVNDLIAQVG